MRNKNTFKAVIFDLGNVVIDFDHWRAVNRISKLTDKPPEEIFQLFFDSDLTGAFEEGKISPEDFYLRVKDLLGLSITYEEFLPIWNEIFFLSAKNLAVHKIIKDLKQHYPLILLSNINILHYSYLKENFVIFEKFDKTILSCDIGARKPDSVIYGKALQAAEAGADEVIYTDDRLELVEAARKLGIKSFHFRDPDIFKQNLKESGIELDS